MNTDQLETCWKSLAGTPFQPATRLDDFCWASLIVCFVCIA